MKISTTDLEYRILGILTIGTSISVFGSYVKAGSLVLPSGKQTLWLDSYQKNPIIVDSNGKI